MKRRLFRQLGIALTGNVVALGCAPAAGYRAPGSVRAYDILVTHHDSLSREIGRGLKRRGYSVRSAVKGGGAPTAYLFWFTQREPEPGARTDRKSTRLNSSHSSISYAVFCLKKKKKQI